MQNGRGPREEVSFVELTFHSRRKSSSSPSVLKDDVTLSQGSSMLLYLLTDLVSLLLFLLQLDLVHHLLPPTPPLRRIVPLPPIITPQLPPLVPFSTHQPAPRISHNHPTHTLHLQTPPLIDSIQPSPPFRRERRTHHPSRSQIRTRTTTIKHLSPRGRSLLLLSVLRRRSPSPSSRTTTKMKHLHSSRARRRGVQLSLKRVAARP